MDLRPAHSVTFQVAYVCAGPMPSYPRPRAVLGRITIVHAPQCRSHRSPTSPCFHRRPPFYHSCSPPSHSRFPVSLPTGPACPLAFAPAVSVACAFSSPTGLPQPAGPPSQWAHVVSGPGRYLPSRARLGFSLVSAPSVLCEPCPDQEWHVLLVLEDHPRHPR